MKLGPFSLLVRDYDEAIDWYTRVLGFTLVVDEDQGHKRWVVVETDDGGTLVLARAKNASEKARIGDQHGGRIGFFLEVEAFDEAHRRMLDLGVVSRNLRATSPMAKSRYSAISTATAGT